MSAIGIQLLAVLFAVLGAIVGCGDDHQNSSLNGPGIDVHCAALTPRPGVGDTSVRVTCPPQVNETPQ
jgi:hypothetical protein